MAFNLQELKLQWKCHLQRGLEPGAVALLVVEQKVELPDCHTSMKFHMNAYDTCILL